MNSLAQQNEFIFSSIPIANLTATLIVLLIGIFCLVGRNYLRFLTIRYLRTRILTFLAIFVIMSATTILIVAPSVMNGFSREFLKKVRGTQSDMKIWGPRPFTLPNPAIFENLEDLDEREEKQLEILDEITTTIQGIKGVEAISPYVENPALYKGAEQIDWCLVRGCDLLKEAKVSKLKNYLLSPRGLFDILHERELQSSDQELVDSLHRIRQKLPDKVDVDRIFNSVRNGAVGRDQFGHREGTYPGVLVGVYFLKSFDLQLGDILELTTASDSRKINENQKFTVAGVFQTGYFLEDRRKLIMSTEAAQRFINVEKRISGMSVKLKDDFPLENARKILRRSVDQLITEKKFPRLASAETWKESNRNLLQAVAMERLLIKMITSMIVFVAMLSIFIVLYMSVQEKARDLGILKALGGSTFGIFKIYVAQGILISFLGVSLGVLVGIVVSIYLNEIADVVHSQTGWHPFPPDIYQLDQIPSQVELSEVIQTIGLTTVFAFFLSAIPGLWAANLNPIDATRID